MEHTLRDRRLSLLMALFLGVSLAACAGSGSVITGNTPVAPEEPGEPSEPRPPAEPEQPSCDGPEYESTFDAVEKIVFDRYDCRNQGCHGQGAAAGGLDLSPGVAWANLHDVDAVVAAGKRIVPGDRRRSLLYTKLAAATHGDETAGSPMPIGLAALSEQDLELVGWWIYGGAPEEGVVLDAEPFIDGCLPDPTPLTIKPLPAPAADEGIQLEMPTFPLEAGLESERCYASWFDICDQIPAELRGERNGVEVFHFNSRELRMDPGSHHLILNWTPLTPDQLDHPDFGEWKCRGGSRAGDSCDPVENDCADGWCASDHREGFTCAGFGPSAGEGRRGFPIGGSQRAQDFVEYPEGVYNSIPCQGVLYWNAHTFNLTTEEQYPNARLNYYFADPDNLAYGNRGGLTGPIFIAENAPYTKETYCSTFTFPRGSRLYEMSSHTHQRGERFWVNGPDGVQIYENLVYNDPHNVRYTPPMEFDSTDPAERTVEFCATYNNGVNEDGSPNPETVTRSSRIPASARVEGSFGECEPIQCVNEGAIGRDCFDGTDDNKGGDHAACDTSPGAGDGFCDACHITGGESTENEMFLMIPSYYVTRLD